MNINKYIFILIVTPLFSIGIKAQKRINMDKNTFDVETFDKHKVNKEYNFEVDNSIIRQVESSNSYAVYITYKNNNYEDRYTYNKETKKVKTKGRLFSAFPIGIFKYYDYYGTLVEERNFDSLYDFTVDQLIEKIKNEYQVDINVNDPTHILVVRENSPYPIYKVIIPEVDFGSRTIIVNGKNGKTLIEIDRDGNEKEINPTPTIPKEKKEEKGFWNTLFD